MATETSIADVAIAGIGGFASTVQNAQDELFLTIRTPFTEAGETARNVATPTNILAAFVGAYGALAVGTVLSIAVVGGVAYVVVRSGAATELVRWTGKGFKAVGSLV